MLLEGFTLTIVGMAVVFIFLTILVFVVKALSAFLPKYFPDKNHEERINKPQPKIKIQNEKHKSAIAAAIGVSMAESEIAAAIAAVKSYSHN